MPTVKEVIEDLQKMDPDEHIAAHVWSTEDVFGRAREDGFCLTQEQANNVIDNVRQELDSELGITWDTISSAIDDTTDKRECTHADEDAEGYQSECWGCPLFKGVKHGDVPKMP